MIDWALCTKGRNPLAEQGKGQFFSVPPSQLLRNMCVPDPTSCARHVAKVCAHVKDPISICRKRVGGMENTKTLHTGVKEKLGSAVLWLFAFPGGKQPEFTMHCIGTRKLSNPI